MIKNKKVAFVVALHQSDEHRPNGFELFNNYLISIYESCEYPFKIFAFDNQSQDKFEVENKPDNLNITRVENQYIGGCTYTWNEGIKMAIKENFDVVVITSDDQIYDNTINNFIDVILTHQHREDGIFGPLSNNPNNNYQRAYQPNNKVFEISGKPGDELNGFCLAMTKESIKKNYFDSDGNFFNTGKEYIWGKQDVEVQQRVGHSIVVGECYVHHIKQGGWREIRSNSKKYNNKPRYEPINLEYFLNMELQPGGGGKEIVLKNKTLKTIGEVVDFWKNDTNIENVKKHLNPSNWQYFNCMIAEFKKDVADHHELGWDKLTKEYFDSLTNMTDEEIELFLKKTPVEFDNGYVRHSYHRACAMIGRLINNKSYIPFYMKKEKIYDLPREKYGQLRISSPIYNVNGLLNIEELGIPKDDFTICQSGILSLMGIRENDDLDIIISSRARNKFFNGNDGFIRIGGVEIFEKNKGKFIKFGATDDDELIKKYSFNVNGYNFLEPRFYFSRKNKKTERDMNDWDGIRRFFEMESYKGYPFNYLTLKQWGHEFI